VYNLSEEEDEKMKTATNSEKKISEHPKYKSKVPRLNVVKGSVQVDAADPVQRKWLEEFKKF
jgi:hypothetical protein